MNIITEDLSYYGTPIFSWLSDEKGKVNEFYYEGQKRETNKTEGSVSFHSSNRKIENLLSWGSK